MVPSDPRWTQQDAAAALDRVRAIVARLPEAVVEETSERGHTGVTLRGTRFAWLLVDHHEDGRLALTLVSTREEQAALVEQDPARFFVPPYSGPQGWVGALVDPASDPDWDQVAELLEDAWRLRAPKRALRAYDARQPNGPQP